MSTAKRLPAAGKVLSTVWNGYKENYKELWKIVLPYLSISVLQGITVILSANNPNSDILLILLIILSLATIGVSIWMSIVLVRAMHQITMTGKLNVDKAKKNIGAVTWPYIAVGIITGILIGLGLLLFIIPGIILALMYFGATYSAIIDKKNVGESLSHSLKIVKGRKWNLFTVLFLSQIAVFALFMVATILIELTLGGIGVLVNPSLGSILSVIGQAGIAGVFIPITTGIGAMLYGHLNKLAK